MVPGSPTEALDSHAAIVSDVVIDVVRRRHNYSADAHQVANTRSTRGYSTLWQDLLIDAQEAFGERGYDLHTLMPAGYKVPIVNGCLVYVWRVPSSGDPSEFAASPTRLSGFDAFDTENRLFGPEWLIPSNAAGQGSIEGSERIGDIGAALDATGGSMPLVIVRFRSSPWQLQTIEWAVAELDRESGEVTFHGVETIWQPEHAGEADLVGVEPFDSGAPAALTLEPQTQERPHLDA